MCTSLEYGVLGIDYAVVFIACFKAWDLYRLKIDRYFVIALFIVNALVISTALTGCMLNDSFVFSCSIPILMFLLAMAECATMAKLRLFQPIGSKEKWGIVTAATLLWLAATVYLVMFLTQLLEYSLQVAVFMAGTVGSIETSIRVREMRIVYGTRKNYRYDTGTFKLIQKNRREAVTMLGVMMLLIAFILIVGMTLAKPGSSHLVQCIIYLISSIVGTSLLIVDHRVIEMVRIKSKSVIPAQSTTTQTTTM